VVIIIQASDQIQDITVVAVTLHSLIREVHDLLIIVVEAVAFQVVAEVVVALAEVLPQA
jgi:hypothetical protein